MAAGLLLVAAAGRGRGLDGLAVVHARLAGLDRDLEARGEALYGHAQMHLALPEEAHLPDFGPVLEREGRILLDDLGERAGEADIVLAILDAHGHRIDRFRRREGENGVGPRLPGREAIAGRDALHAAEAERVAGSRLGHARRGLPHEGQQAPDPGLAPARADD